MNQSIGRQVVVLIVLVFLLIVVGIFSTFTRGMHPREEVGMSVDFNAVPPPPPMTEHMQQVLDASHGFAQFVSYTDNGFEPADTTVRQGDAIRFTNNSSHTMWIMSSGGDGGVYPAIGETCGQTTFDTCAEFPPHEIWEFTFDEKGTWVYRNNAFKEHVAVVRVK